MSGKITRPYTIGELRYLFIDQNLSAQKIADKYGVKRHIIEGDLKVNNIKKPIDLKHKSYKTIDKDELYQYYIIKDFNMVQTAEHFGVGEKLVRKYCRLYGFYKDRKDLDLKMKKTINKEELIQYYLTENHSNEETAAYFGVHERTLRRRLREFGISKSIEAQLECSQAHQKEKYGTLFPQSEYYKKNIKDKMIQKVQNTCIEKYGAPSYFLTPEGKSKCCLKYKYNDMLFDSSWELAFYIYAIDHEEEIYREPLFLEYYVNNKLCHYVPDFLYNGQLIEIKGDHLIKNGKLKNIYKKDELKDAAKQLCMEKNHVHIMTYEDIKFALDYVKQVYGKDYLRQFKNH